MIHPMLAVKDVDASIKFYVEKLGFKQDFVMAGSDGKNAFGWVSLGSSNFGLTLDTDLQQRGNGVVFMVGIPEDADIDQYYAQVKGRGTKIIDDLKTQYWGDRTFTVHDPDGYVLSPFKTVKQVPTEEIAAVMRGEQPST